MLESFTLSGLGLISLDSDDLEKDDYSLLASSSNYRITKVNSVMKKKRSEIAASKPVNANALKFKNGKKKTR